MIKMPNYVLLSMISYILMEASTAHYSCPVSRSTVEVVEMCPDTEGKWKEAAAKKNCTAKASQCSEPARLVYHCVINTYVNQTLEVCAYAQNILDGHCTEYNRGGNLIQGNIQTYCKTFTKKPCPKFYPSTRAYNYPGCYELARKMKSVTVKPESTVNVTTKMDNGSNDLRKQIGALYMSLLVVLLSRLF